MLQNRFKKLLVPLDGSLNSIRGLNEAISLARQCNSKIFGVHIVPIYPMNLLDVYGVYSLHLRKNGERYLNRAKTSAARNGIDFQGKIIRGNETVRLIDEYAKSLKSDLMVIGSRGSGAPKEKFLGSVSLGLLSTSKIPILVVK